MLVRSIAGVVSPDAYWVRPSVLPTVPRLSAIALLPELSVAPSVQPVTSTTGGLGTVLASEPSLLKVIATVEVIALAVVVLESDARVGAAKLALQALVPVFFQLTWIEFAVPSES